jgi:hypothetical protein
MVLRQKGADRCDAAVQTPLAHQFRDEYGELTFPDRHIDHRRVRDLVEQAPK